MLPRFILKAIQKSIKNKGQNCRKQISSISLLRLASRSFSPIYRCTSNAVRKSFKYNRNQIHPAMYNNGSISGLILSSRTVSDRSDRSDDHTNQLNARIVHLLNIFGAGLFHMAYLMTRSPHYLAIFESSQTTQNHQDDDEVGIGMIITFQNLMGYVAGADGLSEIEKKLHCKNQEIWSNYNFSDEFILQCFEDGMNFSDEDLDICIKKYIKASGGMTDITALSSNLYVSLIIAGSDGLSKPEIERYYIMAHKFGVNKQHADKILNTYYDECQLIKSLDMIYNGI